MQVMKSLCDIVAKVYDKLQQVPAGDPKLNTAAFGDAFLNIDRKINEVVVE